MMIKKYQDNHPEINPKAYIAEGGKVIGSVKINEVATYLPEIYNDETDEEH
ncbi:MAG: hypothetical protein SCL54_03600 [Bacillota bacterium]|nr:hypothetical protein [Bacillota bacterium]